MRSHSQAFIAAAMLTLLPVAVSAQSPVANAAPAAAQAGNYKV